MSRSPDPELLATLAAGPEAAAREALGELFRRHAPDVRRFLGRILSDPTDVDDLVQDTFISAARRASAFRDGDARAWLLSLAARRARDLLRKRRRIRRREHRAARPDCSPDAAGSQSAAGGDVAAALEVLSERDRAVLELRFVQGLTHEETAQVLGVSLRTAKSWSARALSALRSRLEAGGHE